MASRTIIGTVAVVLALAIVGVVVWRSIPEIPSIDLPQKLEPEEEFTTVESGEYDDTEKGVLSQFAEQPLTNGTYSEGVTYRLILLPAFERPILVHARLDAAGPYLKTKIINSVEGHRINKLGVFSVNEERQLSKDEWERISTLVENASFWSAPSIDRNDEPMPDGAYWSLYGNNFGVFHRIHRMTPRRKSQILFRYLLQLSEHEQDYSGYWIED